MAKEIGSSLYGIFSIVNDEAFKDVAKYKCVAAIFLKLTVPEFRDLDFYTIMSSIIDRTKRGGNLSLQQLAVSEIDIAKTEDGTGQEKNIRHDFVFDVLLPGKEPIVVVLQPELLATVNFEMQKKVLKSELGYNVISRGIYYAASLLRATVPVGDSKYENIHKVYSIWFCDGYLHLDTLGHKELEHAFVHRYQMVRYYPEELPGKTIHVKEDGADLMEVVFVELPKLKQYGDSDLAEVVAKLFYDTQSFPEAIKKLMPEIDLGQVKEVKEMVDYGALLQEHTAEITKLVTAMVTAEVTEEVTAKVTEAVTAEKDAELAKKDEELAKLREEIARLKASTGK